MMGLKQVNVCVLLVVAFGWLEAQWLIKAEATTEMPPVHLERWLAPVSVPSVTSKCNESAVYVEVKKTTLANSYNIAALTLGGCAAKVKADASQVLIYESKLDGCNSKLTITKNELIYAFTLCMDLGALSDPPILIECHYPRFTNALLPAPQFPEAEEPFVFSLRLMMDDWISERASNQYYLGELINVEASVLFGQVPLRVFVDQCVATTVPETNSIPRYSFIDNYGCLIDAKLTQASSHFIPQTQASKLGFQMEAFRFQQGNSSLIYITCFLKAAVASVPTDAEHKACSFSGDGWASAYGADQVCSCCNSQCSLKEQDGASQGHHLATQVTLGPIMVEDNVSLF